MSVYKDIMVVYIALEDLQKDIDCAKLGVRALSAHKDLKVLGDIKEKLTFKLNYIKHIIEALTIDVDIAYKDLCKHYSTETDK